MFTMNVLALIATSWDGYMFWYEALILVLFAIPYFVIVFQSPRISRFMKRKFEEEYQCICCIGNSQGKYTTAVLATKDMKQWHVLFSPDKTFSFAFRFSKGPENDQTAKG